MNVSCLVACAGGIIEVQTFEGVKKIKIPVGIQNNSKIKLSNLGLPKSLNSLDRGNFYIIVKLIVPALSNEQTLLIKEVIDKNSK
jgi:molecular chaperone DnaJ